MGPKRDVDFLVENDFLHFPYHVELTSDHFFVYIDTSAPTIASSLRPGFNEIDFARKSYGEETCNEFQLIFFMRRTLKAYGLQDFSNWRKLQCITPLNGHRLSP